MKTISFTGHRPDKLGGYNENNATAIWVKDQLSFLIRDYINKDFTKFIWGGALGTDTWAAIEVLKLQKEYPDILLTLYQPFEGMDAKWYDSSKRIFNDLRYKSNSVVTVCDGGYAAWKMQRRNEAMVNNSDLIIAVWDGSSGGTGNCVQYAESQKKPIHFIDPESRRISFINN